MIKHSEQYYFDNLKQEEIEKPKELDVQQILENLNLYIEKHIQNEEKVLREHQFNVFEDLKKFIENRGRQGYIKLPTGTGKTVLFIEFIKALNLRTIIVVPTQILVDQTEKEMQKFASELETGKIYSYKKDFNKQVTITTYDSLVSKVKSEQIKPEDYQVIILDEVHKSLTKKRQNAIDRLKDNALVIGLSATPKYSKGKQTENFLKTEIHSMDIKEAIEDGLLSSLSCIIARTTVDLSSVKIEVNNEYNPEQLEKAINIETRNEAAVKIYEQGFKDKSAIIFCLSINHANDVLKKFLEKGIVAKVISGRQNREEQNNIIERFKKGEVKVLLSVDLLTEGFDALNASVCINLAPTYSHVRAEQRCGRILRLNEKDPDKHAYVIDFLDEEKREKKSPILFSEIINASAVYPKIDLEKKDNKPCKEKEKNLCQNLIFQD